MKKAWEWLIDDYNWLYVCVLIFVLFVIGAFVYVIASPSLTEGMVMNKWASPGYSHCTDKGCEYRAPRWIITVQDGESKDWWYVSQSYYDSVHIGDWVKK